MDDLAAGHLVAALQQKIEPGFTRLKVFVEAFWR
jgi:hypothetical protein